MSFFDRIRSRSAIRETVRDICFGAFVALLVLLTMSFWLTSDAHEVDKTVHDAELEYASFSPRGEQGGSVIPASCESGVEHWPGDVCGTPTPVVACITGELSGSRVNVSWPAVPGAVSYMPRLQGITPDQCNSLPGWSYAYGSCNHDDYRATSATFPLNRGQQHNFWVHARDPMGSNNTPISFSCPVLPTPTILGWSCVLGPAGERQLRISWNRAPGYPDVYVRTQQNGVYPYAPGTSEQYAGDSVSFTITPGASYDFWMHTRDAQGSYSDAVGINGMVCNNPPPPTNPSSQCTYNSSTGIFTARISWDAPAGYDTFYTRVSTAGYGNDNPTARVVWEDDFRGTTFTFPAQRNISTRTPQYYWWVHTRDTSNGWWSADINQNNITPGAYSFACPLPPPEAITNKTAACTATPWDPANSVRFTMSARFAEWYGIQYRLVGSPTTNNLSNVQSGHTLSPIAWGEYEWRVIGRNQDEPSPTIQSSPSWSSWEDFACLPPDPVISINATPALVTKGSSARLTWRIQANYDMDCTLRGGGIPPERIEHRYNPAAPATLTTERTTSNPFVTTPIQNTTDFTISCDPQIPTLPNLPIVEQTVRVEVVPILEER